MLSCVSAERPLDSVRQWWDNVAQVLNRQHDAHVILMIDANAPLADHVTEFFGVHQAEETNPQGLIFQDFLIANRFFVPSTFEEHQGVAATWRHPRGQHLRRDYVVTSEFFRTMVAHSCVLTDFDGGFGHVDHSPAMIVIQGSMRIGPTKSKLRWDYQKNATSGSSKAISRCNCHTATSRHGRSLLTITQPSLKPTSCNLHNNTLESLKKQRHVRCSGSLPSMALASSDRLSTWPDHVGIC